MAFRDRVAAQVAGWISGRPRAEFDGSRSRRRLSGWVSTANTINTLLAQGGDLLRNRSRDIVRNNPYAASAAESFKANLIGPGIKPSSKAADAAVRKAIQEKWLEWVDEADADSLCDFYGLQELGAKAIFEAGEFFVRFRPRRAEDGLSVPLQLQLMPGNMVPFWHNTTAENGNVIMNGIEFDLIDRRVAYWFHKVNPGEQSITPGASFNASDLVRVPATEVLHVFRPQEPGQIRGVPVVSPALVKLFFLDQYDDAELERKKTAAMYAGFIKSARPDGPASDPDVKPGDTASEGVVDLKAGTMQVLLPGEEIEFSKPGDVGGSYEAFQYRNLLAVFTGLGIPYALGTGDLKRANYSSLRGAIVEYRRRLQQMQHNIFAFQLCRPVWARWMNAAVLSGALDLPGFAEDPRPYLKVKWIPPKFDWVDPMKDQQAEKLAVDAGFKARSDVIEEMGEEPEETDRRIAADKARERELGLDFPVAKAASSQPGDAAGGPSPEDAADEAAANANEDLADAA
jgi:lambda family phage portal protein